MTNTLYTATSTAWGGRDGKTTSDDGRLALDLSIPKGLGGDGGPGTNPEQLFAAGYAACFHSALKAIARQRKLDVTDSAVSVTISVIGDPASVIDLAARIEAQLPGLPRESAQTLLDEAHQMCPYSRATRNNIAQDVVLVAEDD